LTIAAPPVAAARFLRLVYGESVLVTYVGDCPSATDPEIDARFSPVGFFASLHRQGVFVDAQATEMDDADAERWRRHLSMPGGLPARRFLARAPVDRLLREVDVAHADAQQWGATRSNILLDLAETAGCACGGNRVWIEESEGARSSTPILVPPPGLSLRPEPSAPPPRGSPRARPRIASAANATHETDFRLAHDTTPNDDPTAVADEATATAAPAPLMPPSTPVTPPVPIPVARQPVRSVSRPVGTRTSARSPVQPEPRNSTRRTLALSLLPALVLALTGALGVAVYAGTVTPAPDIVDDVRSPAPTAATPAPVASNGTTATPPLAADTVARRAKDSSSVMPADSAAQAARRRLRRRAPEVVPGWLPQGQKSFNPADTAARRVPDSSGAKPPARPDTIPRA
jgi:hypothetical protein